MRPLNVLKGGAVEALDLPRRFFRRRHPPPGARPGTLVVDADAPPSRLTLVVYSSDGVEEHTLVDPSPLPGLLRTGGKVWLDVVGLGSEQVLRTLAHQFGIHALAIEDIVHVGQRPKIDSYAEHLLIVARAVHHDDVDILGVEQVSLLLGRAYLVTFRERPGELFDPVRRRLQEGLGPMRESGVDYLAYALLDTVVDGYHPLLEDLGDEIEQLEESVTEGPHPESLERLTLVKRALLQLRRAVVPLREAVKTVGATPNDFFTDTTRTYLRDTHDHCAQATDVVEAYREVANGLFNTYLSAVGNRTNEIMRVLTVMASIFIPLTFLAGIYGMNFQHMPELAVWWSYPLLLGLMLSVGVGMAVHFRRRGWIGSPRHARPDQERQRASARRPRKPAGGSGPHGTPAS